MTTSPPTSGRTAPSGRATLGLGVLGSLGLVGALGVVRYLPTHDGPQHIYLANLDNHFSDPGATYSDYYLPTTALASKGFAMVFGPLAELLPWRSALQVTLGVIVLTWAWGVLAFVNAVAPGRRLLGLVGFALAFQYALYMGFFSFLLSSGIGLFTLAIAFGSAEWPWKRRLSIAALLLVQALCHVFAAEVMGLSLLVLVLCRHARRDWPRELGLLALMGVPTGIIAVHAAGWIGTSAEALPYTQAARLWPPFAERVELLATAFAAGPWWRAWPPVLLALAGIGFGIQRVLRRTARPEERALLALSVLLGAAALAFPLHSRQWEFMSVRFIPMAVVFGLSLVPVETFERRVSLAIHGAVLVLAASAIGWAGWHNQRLEQACGPALAGLDAPLSRKGPRLPIVLDPSCNDLAAKKAFVLPGAEPLLNLGDLYAVQQGGVVPYAFVDIPQLHGFVLTKAGFKRFPDIPNRKKLWGPLAQNDPPAEASYRSLLLASLAQSGRGYEDVLFYGSAKDRDQIVERGYVTDFDRDGMWIGHYRGCPLKLEVSPAAPRTAPLVVEYGWQPWVESTESKAVPRVAVPEDEAAVVVEWAAAPCGPIWVRAGVDVDGSGRWSPAGGKCEGADAEGRLPMQRKPGTPAARCVLRMP